MNRRTFLCNIVATLSYTTPAMTLTNLNRILSAKDIGVRMPVLFLGHGSPMNAIENNTFVKGFKNIAKGIPRPKVILCISAHWETYGTKVTAMDKPRTIYDFGGFPDALYNVKYPAPGSPILAKETKKLITSTPIQLDYEWGLDHGTWAVIKHMYPKADIPVVQLSLDYRKSPADHYKLAKELIKLRDKGVLIIGSGNLVHNLQKIDWKRPTEYFGYDWAMEAHTKIKQFILEDKHDLLMNYDKQGREFQLSVPTPEHYFPLLYNLGLKTDKDNIHFFNDEFIAGSLSMTSIKIG